MILLHMSPHNNNLLEANTGFLSEKICIDSMHKSSMSDYFNNISE